MHPPRRWVRLLLVGICCWIAIGGAARAWAPDISFLGDPATHAIHVVLGGRRHLIPDIASLEVMGFSLDDVRWLDGARIARYPAGINLLPMRPGDLVRDPATNRHYLLDAGKRWIPDEAAMRAGGWAGRPAIDLPPNLVQAMPSLEGYEGLAPGALVRARGSDCLYLLAGGKRWIPDALTMESCGWRGVRPTILSADALAAIPEAELVPTLLPGSLLRASGDPEGPIYLLDGARHRIPDAETFAAYGWSVDHVRDVDPALLEAIPEGARLEPVVKGENLFVLDNWGQCTWYVAERRIAPSWRSAKYWFEDARRAGYAVGDRPMPGAVMVYDGGQGRGIYGHVAYVEAVYADGSFARVDSNICGWECVRTRVTDLGHEVGVLGFVYWRYESP